MGLGAGLTLCAALAIIRHASTLGGARLSWPSGRNPMSAPPKTESEQQSFAEAALRLSGKTEEEARRTGAVDQADEQVEALFLPRYQTTNSPVHKAVWDGQVPLDLFAPPPLPSTAPCDVAMQKSLEVVKR